MVGFVVEGPTIRTDSKSCTQTNNSYEPSMSDSTSEVIIVSCIATGYMQLQVSSAAV